MSYKVRQNPASPTNYTVGRQGAKVNKIVIHHAATTDFDGIGRTFQAIGRNASAHYGVGRSDNVDQYVSEANTAWHAGNWNANISSVGIENVNSSGAPDWSIDEKTFDTLVELVRDIAKRHGLLPLKVGVNLFGHKDFSATACPGVLYARLGELAKEVNSGTSSGGGSTNPSKPSKKTNDQIADEVIAGKWGNGPQRQQQLQASGYDYGAIQALVNQKLGTKPAPAKKTTDAIANEVIAGLWGNGPQRQQRITAAGYDYNAVQALVNKKLGVSGGSAPARKSNEQVADEVIKGLWGNGDDRIRRLQNAGYNYNTIQSIVNRKLG